MSAGDPNGIVEATVLENMEGTGRDIRNHMLFEVSTEAANRGIIVLWKPAILHVSLQSLQLEASIP